MALDRLSQQRVAQEARLMALRQRQLEFDFFSHGRLRKREVPLSLIRMSGDAGLPVGRSYS
jgi:hypothetical protein